MWFDRLKLNRYERIIDNARYLPREVRSVLAGSSRSVRLEIEDDVSSSEYVVQSVAAGVVSPLTFLYVWWLLNDAQSRGIQRLYFLARDGEIFLKVARVLTERWSIDIELRYLYVSRESLLLPSFNGVNEFERYWVPWGYLSTITLDEICTRLNLHSDDINKLFISSLGYIDPESPLNRGQIEKVLAALDSEEGREAVKKQNVSLRHAAVSYLKQEGLCENIPYAVVDTGWKGTSQYALSLILSDIIEEVGSSLSGYYVGLNDGVFEFNGNSLRPFLFDWSKESRDYRLYNFLCFEMFFAAKHGRTKSYCEDKNSFSPVLDEEVSTQNHWIVDAHHKAAENYALHVTKILTLKELPKNSARLCRQMMKAFISSPGKAEAKTYGDYLIASEIREKDMQQMAPEMSFGDFRDIVFGRKKISGYWPQASFVRSDMKIVNFGYCCFLDLKLLDLYRKYILRY